MENFRRNFIVSALEKCVKNRTGLSNIERETFDKFITVENCIDELLKPENQQSWNILNEVNRRW